MERLDWWRAENPDPEIAERESQAMFKALAGSVADQQQVPDSSQEALLILARALDAIVEASPWSE